MQQTTGSQEGLTHLRTQTDDQVPRLKREPTSKGTPLMAFKLSVGKTAICGLDPAYSNEAIAALEAEDPVFGELLLSALPAPRSTGQQPQQSGEQP